MDVTVTIVMMIPVILAVALIINVVRKNITERAPGEPIHMVEVVPAVVILLVAVMIIGSMAYSVTDLEDYDEDTNTLTIKASVQEADEYPWDSYGSSVKSLILTSDVESVPDGVFDNLTGLEHISISDRVESITASAFGVTLKDYMGQTITELEAGNYVGSGDGTLYYSDISIFRFNSNGDSLLGLTTEASGAKYVVLPVENNGVTITSIGAYAFNNKTSLLELYTVPGGSIATIANSFCYGCSGLTRAILPESTTSLGESFFSNCTSLATIVIPEGVTSVPSSFAPGCTSLATIVIPEGVTSIGDNAFMRAAVTEIELSEGLASLGTQSFRACSSATSVDLPSTLTSIGDKAFQLCTGVTSVEFAEGFNPTLGTDWAVSWTFYDSDGTTELDKTVASNLAGFTFQGTASALVKVLPGRSVLTAEQTLQVQELTKKAALTETKILLLDETEISSVEEKELASA